MSSFGQRWVPNLQDVCVLITDWQPERAALGIYKPLVEAGSPEGSVTSSRLRAPNTHLARGLHRVGAQPT
jgi:hypothetical protein